MRRRALLAASQMAGGESDNGLSDYFNVISHEDQEIAFSFDSQYNFNDGSGWHDLEMWEPVSIPKDSILYVANTDIDDTFPYPRLLGDAQNISLAGNIMSLVYGHNFREQYSLKGLVDIFTGFANKDIDSLAIKNIENLILPATELSEYCYSSMFYGCEYIKKAPELPASVLVGNCYESMFEGCSNLNYIKMLATDISASYCLNNWVSGVSTTGTFVKHPEATWNVRGVNGVPEGWTIKFDGEEEGGTYDEFFGQIPPESTSFDFPLYITVPFVESVGSNDRYYERQEDNLALQLREWFFENAEYTKGPRFCYYELYPDNIYINGVKVSKMDADLFDTETIEDIYVHIQLAHNNHGDINIGPEGFLYMVIYNI